VNTIGMLAVAAFAGCGVPPAMITAAGRRTSSSASEGRREVSPPDHR
jgi:hypothetical protein